MKTKSVILATALGLGLAMSASAQTVVRLTGSTAFRASVHQSILALMPDEIYSYTGSSGVDSASQAIFKGTIAGNAVIVKTSWSGSAAGIRDVAAGSNVNFLSDAVVNVPATPGFATAGGTAGVATGVIPEVPQLAMSDVFQGSTVHTTPTLTDKKVAVVPFKWIANESAPASFTNMAPGVAQKLFLNGDFPLAMYTGLPADHNTKVYAVGRDPESGTRITAMAECGLGAFATVLQYDAVLSGATVTALTIWPATVVAPIYTSGNNGYGSGGLLRDRLAATTASVSVEGDPAAPCVLVGYLGLSDANTAVTNGAKELAWNGVSYTPQNVYEGRYTFWGYQHLFYKTNSLNTVQQSTANALEAQIKLLPGSAGLSLDLMQVQRPFDGAPIIPSY